MRKNKRLCGRPKLMKAVVEAGRDVCLAETGRKDH
jgi:hypothetical protein